MRALWAAALALLLTTPVAAAGPTRVFDLDGKAIDPLKAGPGTTAVVLVFTTHDCPISNRYAPEIQRLVKAYAARGVRFWLVYPAPGDTPAVIREHRKKFAYEMPAARDTAQELVKLTGVTVTPEVALADATGRLVYRGRIDDRYVDFGLDRPAPTRRDLQLALDEVLAGKAVTIPETRAVGCILSDLVK